MNTKPFNHNFLKACRGEEHSHTPVWYMRQAGRYQPEYRKIREKYSLFEITHRPEVCAEVTMLPVKQLDVDAAILFADIMTPIPSMGINVEIKSSIGPVIDNPIACKEDVEKLKPLNPAEDIPYILDTIKLLREQLSVPLIGFAGAPFTLASYLIEGGPSRNYYKTKAFMHSNPEAWHLLMDKLGEMTITYLQAQIQAGAQAVQIFDSWVGTLNAQDYATFVAPIMQRILAKLAEENVPKIMFGVGAGHLLQEWNKLPLDVIGLDWRTSIKAARQQGITKTVQGNLDPGLLLADWPVLEKKTKAILEQGMENPGFIFNLGHGVYPQVKVETLQRLTAFVHEYSSRIKRSL
ncbi:MULTISPECIES: uroporphyrinogen decarboxylase [Aneurinibacillus]|jgi:uroporphyrinogen decarboxylase|uniref:Uroporphyrinogen decarboxylase n=1 Tax=Aneurinibacillus thermoaerophilus TaxID=143495 RepID=A0A1G8D058_ANETH|nr:MULTISPECIES: uroporphyrinogen decarboxylase [Aneurinibacillus]AMA72270.1 uroporphyrinogen decarboxylase [Aneurinibacillus sp. XH2]MED0674881.1 uroporphyrinogen decarboxylase [Aneurinibacillus thermoaerophilus]MED0679831.1 uroporphyrinogen decarboxylase [Aneurinibacillus thermoaerophilus]MED0735863.1 uroporphyrinogen decarboxylase [Aneurinibacillus thermoaerophilus]MED0758467.1 uroporphyrinogen decarboxylase [Aneurinibacillus thermoaerophilus]